MKMDEVKLQQVLEDIYSKIRELYLLSNDITPSYNQEINEDIAESLRFIKEEVFE